MSALAAARSLPMWQAFRVRDYRLLWSSETISVIGDQFHLVAMSWLVIDLTRSGLALGVVFIAASIPRALLLLPFGVLADRRPPRSLMLAAHVARGVVVGVIAALVLSGAASLPIIAVLAALFGAFDALYLPAQQAFLPRAVAPERLPSANALLQGTMQLASIAVPPFAGVIVAVVGTGSAFAVDSASFVLAAFVVLLLSTRLLPTSGTASPVAADDAPAGAPGESFGAAIRGGIRYVWADPALRTTLLISLVLNFALSGPASVGMPWLAEIRFDAGPTGLGLLSAAWAAGALGGTLLSGNLRSARPGRMLLLAVGLSGVAMLAVGVAPWMPLASVALAVMGAGIGYTNVVAISWLQARVPADMVGRVMSLAMLMGFGIGPVSMGLAGWLLDVDATLMFLGSGLIVLLAAVASALAGYHEAFDAPAPSAQAAAA